MGDPDTCLQYLFDKFLRPVVQYIEMQAFFFTAFQEAAPDGFSKGFPYKEVRERLFSSTEKYEGNRNFPNKCLER